MKISSIKTHLVGCGYRSDWLRSNYRFREDQTVKPLVGFSQLPFDARSSCVAVLESQGDPRGEVEQCRPTGAPLVFVCAGDSLQWWQQTTGTPQWLESVREDRIGEFFDANKDDFSPNAIYRAKTWGRFRTEFQLSFVDTGLMPLVEEEVGLALEKLIERNVTLTKSRLGWDDVSAEQGHWLLKSVFWLVSAKILHDKEIGQFVDLDLTDFHASFAALADHYGMPAIQVSNNAKRQAMAIVAEDIARFSNLSLTTTESLAHVYENTLISKATRSELGTHSTPAYLVDYIVGNLSQWIQEIPENQRSVFEPACGHAAFLVSAMRLMTELLPETKATPGRRRQYLRSRIHGMDKDPFALELARLALTLTDMPNPDGWDLKVGDMFLTDDIEVQSKANTILLANPPFEKFTEQEHEFYKKKNATPKVNNKAVEMFRRSLEALNEGSVFGVVMPQSILHSKLAKEIRQFLLDNFELREISLFADKVFNFADVESVVLLGRRVLTKSKSKNELRFRRIREWEMEAFKSTYRAPNTRLVEQTRFAGSDDLDLRIPDLEEVWEYTSDRDTVGDIAILGQGLFYLGDGKLPVGTKTYSQDKFEGAVNGFVRFEPRDLMLHQLPREYWMNLSADAIDRTVTGASTGKSQVLLNYARVSRGPWRLKALIDRDGHPVTSRFITVRSDIYSLETMWAILNSPVANAYAFAHLGKRDNIVGVMRKIPMPRNASFESIDFAVDAYFAAANNNSETVLLQSLMAEVDAAVMRQYDLPIDLEYQVLSLFDGWERVGVPLTQSELLPAQLARRVRFGDFVHFEKDWNKTNRRRGKLIDKKIAKTLTDAERSELNTLQVYADYFLEKIAPVPIGELEKLEDFLLSGSAKSDKGH